MVIFGSLIFATLITVAFILFGFKCSQDGKKEILEQLLKDGVISSQDYFKYKNGIDE